VSVKGLAEPVEVHEVIGGGRRAPGCRPPPRAGSCDFVGRDDELQHLRRTLQRAGAGHGQLTAIVGAEGVGKSRSCVSTRVHPSAP
jgi:hypothetical protein